MQAKFFQQILSLTRLSVSEVEVLISIAHAKTIKKKSLLTKPKLVVRNAYFLKSGIVRHFVKDKSEKEFTKNFIRGPRFMLPSLSDFFMQTPSAIYCEALTDLDVFEWDYHSLIQFADQHPTLYKFLLMGAVRAFKTKEQKEISLYQLDASTLYEKFLNDFPNLINEVPIQHVASYLNIRPETLSRIRANRSVK